MDTEHLEEEPTKRIYVPIEDAKLKRLLEESEATGLTVEAQIQRSVYRVYRASAARKTITLKWKTKP
jgi:hypothetical protein